MRRIAACLSLIVLIGSALACGSNTGKLVNPDGSSAGSSSAGATDESYIKFYQVGDVIQVEHHTVTLNSATIKDRILDASFTIENNGDTEIGLSSLASFTARDADGVKLMNTFTDCGGPGLDGKVAPGAKVQGDVCWGIITNATRFTIYYEASVLASGAAGWQVSQ